MESILDFADSDSMTRSQYNEDYKMKKFKVSLQIGFYSEPYEYWTVLAHDKKNAISLVNLMLPKYIGHRFLNVVELE